MAEQLSSEEKLARRKALYDSFESWLAKRNLVEVHLPRRKGGYGMTVDDKAAIVRLTSDSPGALGVRPGAWQAEPCARARVHRTRRPPPPHSGLRPAHHGPGAADTRRRRVRNAHRWRGGTACAQQG